MRNALLATPFLLAAAIAQAAPVAVPNSGFETTNGLSPGNPNGPLIPSGTDAEQFDGMMTETPDSPANWKFSYEAFAPTAANGLWGVAIPRANGTGNNNHYGSKPGFDPDGAGPMEAPTSLPSPFEGVEYAFINLNNDITVVGSGNTIARADSDIIGSLEAGTYTLMVAVGARSTTAWRNIDYSAGLVSGDAELGIFMHQIMDPDSAAGNLPLSPTATDQVNIADLVYTLTIPENDPLIGQPYSIRIRAANTGVGGTGAFTQANFDNVRLFVGEVPEPATLGLIMMGGLLLSCRRRQR